MQRGAHRYITYEEFGSILTCRAARSGRFASTAALRAGVHSNSRQASSRVGARLPGAPAPLGPAYTTPSTRLRKEASWAIKRELDEGSVTRNDVCCCWCSLEDDKDGERLPADAPAAPGRKFDSLRFEALKAALAAAVEAPPLPPVVSAGVGLLSSTAFEASSTAAVAAAQAWWSSGTACAIAQAASTNVIKDWVNAVDQVSASFASSFNDNDESGAKSSPCIDNEMVVAVDAKSWGPVFMLRLGS